MAKHRHYAQSLCHLIDFHTLRQYIPKGQQIIEFYRELHLHLKLYRTQEFCPTLLVIDFSIHYGHSSPGIYTFWLFG